MNNSAQGGGNNGGYGGGATNNNGTQQNLQAQLVQQLSQQLSQSMGQKFPPGNLQALLASMQSQMQNPPQAAQQQQQPQLPPELLALARSGNFAGMNAMANGTQQKQPAPAPMAGQQPAAASGQLQQLSMPPNMGAPSPAMPVAKDNNNNNNNNNILQQHKPTAPPSLGNVGEVRAGFQGQPSAATTTGGNATVDASKDERRKAPGSVIVPCRARGMPMDHNFKVGSSAFCHILFV